MPGGGRVEERHAILHPSNSLLTVLSLPAPAAIVCDSSKRGARRVFTCPRVSTAFAPSLSREWLSTWLACLLAGGDTAGIRCYWIDCLTHLHPRSNSWMHADRCVDEFYGTTTLQHLDPWFLYIVATSVHPSRSISPGRSPDLHCSPVKLGCLQRPTVPICEDAFSLLYQPHPEMC